MPGREGVRCAGTTGSGGGVPRRYELDMGEEYTLGARKILDKNGNIKPKFSKSKVMKLSDTDMEKIASKLCDDYCDQLYWSSLEIIADNIINR